MGIAFISIFLLKARVLNLTISKRKNLSLSLKVETDQFVICLVLPESHSAVKICCISPPDSEANRDGRGSFSVVFLSNKNSSPREKVGKLSSLAESLFVSFIATKYNILPRANNGCSCEKKFWLSDLLTPSARECTIEIWSTLPYTEFDCVALLAML